ncbi:MAG: hypothetical protein WC608_04995 [Parcubacteria group bacterium]
MIDFWKKYKLWLSVAITVVLIGTALFFGAYKLIENINFTSNVVQEKTIDNENNQSRIAKIPEMEAARQSFRERESDLDASLDESTEIDFIKKLEALAEITGNKISLKINEADPAKPASAAKAKDAIKETILGSLPYDKYITVQISLEGGYAELINFIHKIENFSYYLNIISINAVKNVADQSQTQKGASPFNASRTNEKITLEKETIKTAITIVVYLKK